MLKKNGKIIKGIGGFYYVDADDVIYECKGRGAFKNKKILLLVGDNVEISINDNAENTIDKIYERKNELVRPPLANIDNLFIVSSLVDPKINTLIIDKLAAIAEYKNIEPVIILTKTDMADDSECQKYLDIYEKVGFKVIVCDNTTGKGADEVKALLNGKISAFTGNTGVGKSTLLNNIFPELKLATGETSKKLGRGKHTTRHCELFKFAGGYIADTPGFSSLDFERCEKILKDELPYCFREFKPFLDGCKFTSCSHTCDKGCAVCKAVDDGIIPKSRLDSYISMYNDVKDIKQWQMK